MKRTLTLVACAGLVAACSTTPAPPPPTAKPDIPSAGAAALGPPPTMKVLASGLSNPWELTWGPDNFLWATEKTGKQIQRINPADGAKSVVLAIPEVSASGAQDGLLGLAFAPGSVFVAYDYDADPAPPVNLRGKIVRYAYDQAGAKLSNPVDVMTDLPASEDHNAGRLVVSAGKLYYSIGDQGNNQFDRACVPIRAQDLPTDAQVAAKDWSTYVGKTLRMNFDGTVPTDNPQIKGVRSHVFTYGHRNPQGLAAGPDGKLFSDEHGPKSDDEINLLRPGGNYGWPLVAGFRDEQSYRYSNWSAAPGCAGLEYDDYDVPASVPKGPGELQWSDPTYTEPLKTIYTVPTGHNFRDPACGEEFDLCWPSIAPSSLDYVPADNAPNPALANALLVPSLKNGAVYVLKLTQDGGSVQGDVLQLFRTRNRYRDVALSPDHTKIYVATDSEGKAGPQSGSVTGDLDNPGSILEFALNVPGAAPKPGG
ncbi:glucose/sorbosone family PQQ-dependent dehydrogenase [Pseudonocardia spinosispora]|uniref:glucose/sorbosone family PQQ-dependent dehydrogenase n=1 Tax=Pseudonocardia spinosispora TaxID=103441 RepID=UPI000412789A|nr:glucose/sorbosone family PQQ-dependent dehydrogenase [Pseudonocardia spinosispora]